MVFSAFERMVAFRYLRARRQEGFISVIAGFSFMGIAIGVATLIVVMSVMNGFREELLERILGINGHANVFSLGSGDLEDYDEVASRIDLLDEVVHAIPMIEGQVMATNNQGNATGAMVRAMKPADIRRRPLLATNIIRGSLSEFSKGEGVLVGSSLARRLGLLVGDEITLLSPKGRVTVVGRVPRVKNYKIAGVFEVGMFEYDNNFIFMPLDKAQLYFQMPKTVTSVEVLLKDPDAVDRLKKPIRLATQKEVRIFTWKKANEGFFNAIQVERTVMFLILTLIIIVAAFNIISSMIMLVKDKGRDIAILRTMGATRGMAMRIFFLTGASIGIVGTFAGFGLGVAFSQNIETIRQWVQNLSGVELFDKTIYFLSKLPAKMDWGEVGLIVAMSLTLSVLATLYPSWRAARLDPVEALRYE